MRDDGERLVHDRFRRLVRRTEQVALDPCALLRQVAREQLADMDDLARVRRLEPSAVANDRLEWIDSPSEADW